MSNNNFVKIRNNSKSTQETKFFPESKERTGDISTSQMSRQKVSSSLISQGLKRRYSEKIVVEPATKKKKIYIPTPQISYATSHATTCNFSGNSNRNRANERLRQLRENIANNRKELCTGLENIAKTVSSHVPAIRNSKNCEPQSKSIQNRLQKYKYLEQNSNNKYQNSNGDDKKLNQNKIPISRNSTITQNTFKPIENRSYNSNSKRTECSSAVTLTTPFKENLANYSKSNLNTSITNASENLNSSLNEAMDWEPIDEASMLENIKEVRKEVYYSSDSNNAANKFDTVESNTANGVYIVVDTNIFISQLPLLKNLMDTTFTDTGCRIIYVPWMVIQELDYMKEQRGALQNSSRKAIQFINLQLERKHPQLKGQTAMDATKCKSFSKNPDDAILCCCIHLVEEEKRNVILLTNDINLRNKALIHNIESYNHNRLLETLNKNRTNSCQRINKDPILEIKVTLSDLLNYIIEQEMFDAYGNVWKQMLTSYPPYTLDEALDNLNHFWRTVYSFHLQKQCKQTIESLHKLVKDFKYGDNMNKQTHKFVETSLSLCMYLKMGYHKYKDKISKCITNIQKSVGK